MSIYNFIPAPNTEARVVDFATWIDGFSSEEINKLITYAEANLNPEKATVGGKDQAEEYSDIRKSRTGWVSCNESTQWIYDRLAHIVRSLNSQYWQFDLTGFVEDFQYTLYEGEQSHYTWHVDQMKGNGANGAPRKLSLVMQLSDPYEYEGGDLEIKTGPGEAVVPKQKGLISAFPSYTLHRVTPLTSGTRRTLVIWVSGPPFK